jgi:hypothetical protein
VSHLLSKCLEIIQAGIHQASLPSDHRLDAGDDWLCMFGGIGAAHDHIAVVLVNVNPDFLKSLGSFLLFEFG